jgi:hypothetical protein
MSTSAGSRYRRRSLGYGLPQTDIPLANLPDRLKAALSGSYALERELGAGGMATVSLALVRRTSSDAPGELTVATNWFGELRARLAR